MTPPGWYFAITSAGVSTPYSRWLTVFAASLGAYGVAARDLDHEELADLLLQRHLARQGARQCAVPGLAGVRHRPGGRCPLADQPGQGQAQPEDHERDDGGPGTREHGMTLAAPAPARAGPGKVAAAPQVPAPKGPWIPAGGPPLMETRSMRIARSGLVVLAALAALLACSAQNPADTATPRATDPATAPSGRTNAGPAARPHLEVGKLARVSVSVATVWRSPPPSGPSTRRRSRAPRGSASGCAR